MQELTNAPPAIQAASHAITPQPVRHVMQETSEHYNQVFAYAEQATSNLSSKTVQESAKNAHKNARHVLKVPLNAHHAMTPSTEFKDTIHSATRLASARQVTVHLPTVHAFRVTANQTSGAATVKPIFHCVSSARQQPKESSKRHNTSASAKMDSTKLKTELASRVPVDVQDAHPPPNVTSVYHKLLSIQMGPAHV
jgi:hypothetical protein